MTWHKNCLCPGRRVYLATKYELFVYIFCNCKLYAIPYTNVDELLFLNHPIVIHLRRCYQRYQASLLKHNLGLFYCYLEPDLSSDFNGIWS